MRTESINRRQGLWAVAGLLAPGWLSAQGRPAPLVEIWKSPDCGCCKDWAAHLSQQGFETRSYPTGNDAARKRLGMPDRYGACHTARVQGYLLEGHVPAREVWRLLREKPAAIGLAVPAMPIGSPGMDGPAYGGHHQPYEVLLVARDGSAQVYQSYR